MANLEQTRGKVKVTGEVTRMDGEYTYSEKEADSGRHQGKMQRKLSFGVKTSEGDEIRFKLSKALEDEVMVYSNAKENKKEPKKYIPFEEWHDAPEGYAVIETRIGLEYGDDGKLISKGMPAYVAAETLYNELKNGDLITVEGNVGFYDYTNQQGVDVQAGDYYVQSVHRAKPLTDDDGNEVEREVPSYFSQDVIFVDAEMDTETKKQLITGRIIDYQDGFVDRTFVVDLNEESENSKEEFEEKVKLAKGLAKNAKFGDFFTFHGKLINRPIFGHSQDDDDDDEDDIAKLFGGGGASKPKHATRSNIIGYNSEMSIRGIESYESQKYDEDDFIIEEKEDNPFAGIGNESPFANDDDDDFPFA